MIGDNHGDEPRGIDVDKAAACLKRVTKQLRIEQKREKVIIMESSKQQLERFVLILDEEEARWLKQTLARPLPGRNETVRFDNEMRDRFYTAINRVLPNDA